MEFIKSYFQLSARDEEIIVAYKPNAHARFYKAKGT